MSCRLEEGALGRRAIDFDERELLGKSSIGCGVVCSVKSMYVVEGA